MRKRWFLLIPMSLTSAVCSSCGDDDNADTGSDSDTDMDTDTDTDADTDMDTDTDTDADTDADTDSDTDTADMARWTYMIFMNGDNNLEGMVTHDLNELEQVGSGDGVNVIVQADRIEGYATDDGDWTTARRYYIFADDQPHLVTSTVVEELGEIDMGDPEVLSEFLMWAYNTYPAEQYALVMWNHGDSWTRGDEIPEHPTTRGISWDETSGNFISITDGELSHGLEEFVAAHGRLDLIGFDACKMGSWEVAHSLRDQVRIMTGSPTTVFEEGYMYAPAIELLRDIKANADALDLGVEMARSPVEDGHEWSHSATLLTKLDDLNTALDELAGMVIENESLIEPLLEAREQARGADSYDPKWYLDIRDLGVVLTGSSEQELQTAGEAIVDGIDSAVLAVYGNPPYEWIGGLTIMFDYNKPYYLHHYANGPGATWAQETRWDDLLFLLAQQ